MTVLWKESIQSEKTEEFESGLSEKTKNKTQTRVLKQGPTTRTHIRTHTHTRTHSYEKGIQKSRIAQTRPEKQTPTHHFSTKNTNTFPGNKTTTKASPLTTVQEEERKKTGKKKTKEQSHPSPSGPARKLSPRDPDISRWTFCFVATRHSRLEIPTRTFNASARH